MTKKEVITFMERIRSYYPKQFVIDKYNIDSWNEKLQYYSYNDVNAKLDKHLQSAEFKDNAPSLEFIIKYLNPTTTTNNDYAYECKKCHKVFNSKKEYDSHYDRCVEITTMIRDLNKYFEMNLTRNQFERYDNSQIDQLYNKYCFKMLALEKGAISTERRDRLLKCLPEELRNKYIEMESEEEENGEREKVKPERDSQSNTRTEDIQPTRDDRQVHR